MLNRPVMLIGNTLAALAMTGYLRYPDTIHHMVIYGTKARGDSHPDSDLDVLLIVRNEAEGYDNHWDEILRSVSLSHPSLRKFLE